MDSQKPDQKQQEMVKKSDGTIGKNGEENAEVFRSHFDLLFDRQPEFNLDAASWFEQSPILLEYDDPPDDEEIKKAVLKLKDKAPGNSGLLPRFWKALLDDEVTFDILKQIILDFWRSEKPPKQWLKGLLKILPKKGDLSLPGNYRGIMLLEAAYKIVTILLLNRLQPICENLDHEQQCGFRPGRGCNDAIFTVKMAIKKRREHSQETWILFLDLVKAFDRVPRQLLWDLLVCFGVPKKLVRLLKSLHKDVFVKFEVDGFTHEIRCTIGVKQGDVLGPVLFTIFMVGVMKSWREKYDRPVCMFRSAEDYRMTGRRYDSSGEAYSLDDSEYADDTAVLFVNRASVETYCPLLVNHFNDFGMEIHAGDERTPDKESKTKVLFVAAPPSTYEDPSTYDDKDLSPIKIDEFHYFPVVDNFCYLGSIFTRDCKDEKDVLARIDAAGGAFGSIRKALFSNASVAFTAKKVVYEGLILKILLYASESWSLTESLFNLLRRFHARCVRSMCRINRWHVGKHGIRTTDILQRLGLKTIDAYITKRQLQWAGHVSRMPFERLPRKMLSSWTVSKRPVRSSHTAVDCTNRSKKPGSINIHGICKLKTELSGEN